jgi:polyphosphate kinase 2 (PPK2 family)
MYTIQSRTFLNGITGRPIVLYDFSGGSNNSCCNEILSRYRQINDFERYLSENHVVILKFFLHINKDEQKKRLQERIEDPIKHWKISKSDLQDRKYWDKYMKSYEETLSRCSTSWAPWYVIPANVKWFRNWAIAQIIVNRIDRMKLKFPEPKIDVSRFIIEYAHCWA